MDFVLSLRNSSPLFAIYDIKSMDLKVVGILMMFKGTYIIISNWELTEEEADILTKKFL